MVTDTKTIRLGRKLRSIRLLGEGACATHVQSGADAAAQPVLADQEPSTPSDVDRLEPILLSIAKTTQQLATAKVSRFQELEQAACEIAMCVAEHVVGKQASIGEINLQPLVEAGIRQLSGDKIRVRMHPEDFERFQKVDLDITSAGDQIEFTRDPSLKLGSCVVESEEVQLASTLEQRLANAKRLVMEGLDRGRN